MGGFSWMMDEWMARWVDAWMWMGFWGWMVGGWVVCGGVYTDRGGWMLVSGWVGFLDDE